MQVKRGTGVEVDRSCLKKSSHLIPRRVVVVETRRHGGHVTWREVVKEWPEVLGRPAQNIAGEHNEPSRHDHVKIALH